MNKTKNIKSISPDPVVNAVVEIRFECNVPKPAVYGVLFKALKDNLGNPVSLPIMQLPEQIRTNDPGFLWKPWYRLAGQGFTAQIGPDVIAINCDCEPVYRKWQWFSPLIKTILARIEQSGIISRILRVGVRYVSFFEFVDIFGKLKLQIELDRQPFISGPTMFVTVTENDGFSQRIALNNDVKLLGPAGEKNGSTVDVDTFRALDSETFQGLEDLIEEAHHQEKARFFSLLQDDFLLTLKPEYESKD